MQGPWFPLQKRNVATSKTQTQFQQKIQNHFPIHAPFWKVLHNTNAQLLGQAATEPITLL